MKEKTKQVYTYMMHCQQRQFIHLHIHVRPGQSIQSTEAKASIFSNHCPLNLQPNCKAS